MLFRSPKNWILFIRRMEQRTEDRHEGYLPMLGSLQLEAVPFEHGQHLPPTEGARQSHLASRESGGRELDEILLPSPHDCSHEIKRRLLLGRKVMTKLDNMLKSRDITLPTKVCLVKAMVFPVVMNGCECWPIKKAEC